MGFLDRLLGRKKPPETQAVRAETRFASTVDETTGNAPLESKNSIILLFEHLPDLQDFSSSVTLHRGQLLALSLELLVSGVDSPLWGHASFGEHRLQIAGFNLPLPGEVQQRTLHMSNWNDDILAEMRRHQAHMLVYYEGESKNPLEQMLALYKFAAALTPYGVLGVADETAHTAAPPYMLGEYFSDITLEDEGFDHNFPVLIWTGILKLVREDGRIWYVSRGHERFGAPDFAFLGLNQGDEAQELFEGLLRYVYFYQALLEPGHTAQLGPHFLRFKAPYEYAEYIENANGNPVLVVEKGKGQGGP